MSDELGWVKLHRSILKQPWFRHSNTLQLFIHLLLSANRIPGYKMFFKGQEYELQPGEYWSTFERLSQETGQTPKQLRTACQHLKETNTMASHSSSQGTVYRLLRWNKYQEVANERANEGQTKGKPRAREQELKKLRTKEITRRNSASAKCDLCENGTGFKRLDDGMQRTECDCLDKKVFVAYV